MENKTKIILLLLVVLGLSACSSDKKDLSNIDTKEGGGDYLITFTLEEIVKGVREWKLIGEKAVIKEDIQKILIDKPRIIFYEDRQEVTYVDALFAEVDSKTKDMKAIGDVVIISLKDDVTITSDSMDFQNSKNLITTDDFVTLVRGESITTGTGLIATSDLSEVNILKDVSIEYKESI